ncbi:hypothetical protein WJX77_007184 [Trebouxia sp. C0004]
MLGDLNRITSKVPVTRFKSEKGHPDDILAKWVFINPLVAHRANSVLIKSGKSTKSLASKMHLTDSAVELPRRKLGTDSNGRDFVQVVHQRANCIITIPAGWLHQVTNFSVCLKLAWELIDANKLYLYSNILVTSNTFVGPSALFGQHAKAPMSRTKNKETRVLATL